MIKLKLPPPFNDDDDDYISSSDYYGSIDLNSSISTAAKTNKRTASTTLINETIDDEYEINSNEYSFEPPTFYHIPKKRKMTKNLETGLVKNHKKKLPKVTSKTKKSIVPTTTIEEVFENLSPKSNKNNKIQIKVAQVFEEKKEEKKKDSKFDSSKFSLMNECMNEFGIFKPTKDPGQRVSTKSQEKINKNKKQQQPEVTFDLTTLTKEELISDREREKNRLDQSQYNDYTVFRNYNSSSDQPSQRLHVKNLNDRKPFSIVHRELYRLFGKFVQLYNEDHLNRY